MWWHGIYFWKLWWHGIVIKTYVFWKHMCCQYFGTCVVNILVLVAVVHVLSIYLDLFTSLDQLESADFRLYGWMVIFWCCQYFGTSGCLVLKCMLAWLHGSKVHLLFGIILYISVVHGCMVIFFFTNRTKYNYSLQIILLI